jgi:hypoxanthine phosphoribosyltransferase
MEQVIVITETCLCLQIDDDAKGYHLEQFCIPKHYESSLENILIPSGLITDR